MKICNRRNLLKNIAVAAPLAGVAYRVFAAPPVAPQLPNTAAKWVPDTDPTAKALGYVADATKAERFKKADVEGKDQNCANCQFYTKGDPIEGKEAGKCLMLPSGAVAAAGWCKSWTKKV